MRTRKANKSKRFSFTENYGIESDDDSDRPAEVEDADEDDDVDFDVTQDAEDGQGASDDDDEDDEDAHGAEIEDDEPLGEADEPEAVDGDGLVPVESEDNGAVGTPRKRHTRVPRGRGRWRKNLPKRTTVHAVPPYPTDLRKTRVYDGPLKRWTRSHQLLSMLYGPDQARLAVARGMFKKWFTSQVLPNKTHSGKGGVMSSPWLAEDYEVKQRQWARAWHERCRAAKQVQRSHKIRPEHIEMFRPPPESLICFLGPFNNQTRARSSYGFGQPLSETGQPQAAIDSELQQEATPAGGWLLDTGGLPLGIGWAPITGRQEQYLAVCTVPPSDQEIKLSRLPEGDLEEKKRGSVQIWSIPCHRADGSHARLVHQFWFDWGRPKRLQWCPIPSPDDFKVGLLAVLCGDGQVRVLEVPRPTSDQTNYGEFKHCQVSHTLFHFADDTPQNGSRARLPPLVSRTSTWSMQRPSPGSTRTAFAWATLMVQSVSGLSVPVTC